MSSCIPTRSSTPSSTSTTARPSLGINRGFVGRVSGLLVFAEFVALIVAREFGHLVVAQATERRVERLSLCFPPKLVSIKRGETEYGIGMIPAGGFVKITGMNPEELEAAEAEAAGTAPAGRPELATAMDSGRDTPQGLLERVEAAGQDPVD